MNAHSSCFPSNARAATSLSHGRARLAALVVLAGTTLPAFAWAQQADSPATTAPAVEPPPPVAPAAPSEGPVTASSEPIVPAAQPAPRPPEPAERVADPVAHVGPADRTSGGSEGPRATWHPKYAVELEAHGAVAGIDGYDFGLGGGARAAIPVWSHAPFRRIDDDLGFAIGFDAIRYAAYRPQPPNGPKVLTSVIYVPVSLVWNIWLGARASMFVEPTLLYRFSSYGDGCSDACSSPTRVVATGSFGFRFRVIEHLAAVVRVGWPMVTLGASWL